MRKNRRCREKFHVALHLLAVSEGDVRSRLTEAYRHLRSLRDEDVPEELRAEWTSILRSLTRYGPEVGSDGTLFQSAIKHTMARIRNRTGKRIAERIYTLARELGTK